jgi:branched-chain amino acid transport system permease protein/neutral amino acid transport system permease protein
LLGSTFALGAIGLSLIFGILRFVHIAQGDFMTLGAYITLFFLTFVFPKIGLTQVGLGIFTFGYPLLLALPLSMLGVSVVAVVLDRLVYRTFRLREAHVIVMAMASLGLAIAMRGVVQMVWGTQPLQYPREARKFLVLPLDVRIPPDNLFLGVASVLLVAGLYLFLTRSKMGKAMRATADNPELARVCGIKTEQVIRWTWTLGASLAATAGSLLAVSQAQLLPILGWKVLIPIFAATILGGVGNLYGAFVGALIVGVSMEVSTQWINPSYKPAVAFAIILLVLLVRPRGLFGGSG